MIIVSELAHFENQENLLKYAKAPEVPLQCTWIAPDAQSVNDRDINLSQAHNKAGSMGAWAPPLFQILKVQIWLFCLHVN